MSDIASLTFGRLAYNYFSSLHKHSQRQLNTASIIVKKLAISKKLTSEKKPASTVNVVRDDDDKERRLIKEILTLNDIGNMGVQPSQQLMSSTYQTRWSNKNVEELLYLVHLVPTHTALSSKANHSCSTSILDGEGDDGSISKELLESEKFVKDMKETALRCVEAISCLTQEIEVDGLSFDVEKTRVHFMRTFTNVSGIASETKLQSFAFSFFLMRAEGIGRAPLLPFLTLLLLRSSKQFYFLHLLQFLAVDEDCTDVSRIFSWDDSSPNSCGGLAREFVAGRIHNEKNQLKRVVAGLTSFLSYLDGITSFVNMEKVSFFFLFTPVVGRHRGRDLSRCFC